MGSKPKVLIIYTGGTIGMIENPETGKLSNVNFEHVFEHLPELKRLNIELESIGFDLAVDSSEMNKGHWSTIAETIFENYAQYDGFVVLHGSDTMSYTSSALSFMLSGLKKPVILTGSQLPIGVIRTDGKENLITAIELAALKDSDGNSVIQEVAVYFDYSLFRGNRCTKDSAEHFEAFRSPSYGLLASAGVEIKINEHLLYRSKTENIELKTELNDKVLLIKLFPSMNFEAYERLISKELFDGIIIESFGSGNMPQSKGFEALLKRFDEAGGIILNITQCNSGKVKHGMYASSNIFHDSGTVAGGNLTTEAAVTKMMFLLANYSGVETKKQLAESVRGEVDF
jgi:L-asparaginase